MVRSSTRGCGPLSAPTCVGHPASSESGPPRSKGIPTCSEQDGVVLRQLKLVLDLEGGLNGDVEVSSEFLSARCPATLDDVCGNGLGNTYELRLQLAVSASRE